MNPEDYIDDLLRCARKSPCSRDKRGALVLRHGEIIGRGWNAPATGECSDAVCQQKQLAWVGGDKPLERVRSCSDVVEHAEAMAIRDAMSAAVFHRLKRLETSLQKDPTKPLSGCELIHLNTEAFLSDVMAGTTARRLAKTSRRRGCAPCAVQAMTRGVAAVWLLHDDGWERYTMREYYDLAVA